MPPHDTSFLVAAARGGDPRALDELIARHRGRLLGLVTCRMNAQLARAVPPDDVVQETCAEAARKIAAFQPDGPSSFYRWLVGIARFKIAEAARSQRAMKRALETEMGDEPAAPTTSPSGRAIQTERAARLREALGALPQVQAEAVRLRWLDGVSVADTARRLGKTEAAVKALVARGLADLAAKLPREILRESARPPAPSPPSGGRGGDAVPEPLEDVQDAILDKLHAGEPVDREATLAAHPEHADALREFFRVLDVIETAPPAESATPATLGEFRILRELGKGGMGVVYEAEQASLKRRVALKVLPPALRTDPRLVARFRREAEAAGKLRHPGIVPVYSVGEVAGTPFFAMEMVEGRSIDAIVRDLREGRDAGVPPAGEERRRWAVETIAKVADALGYAHGRGILHRDVKPANILIDRDGAPRLTDFGLALDADAPGLTMAGEVFGSLHYMSPEQAVRRTTPLDARADVYSLAVTLFEMLTLRLPYEGTTSAELLTALTTGKLQRLRDVDPSIPLVLDEVVMHALRREPAERCASAAEFAADLRATLAGTPHAGGVPPAPTSAVKKSRRIRLAIAVPTAVVLIAALVATAMSLATVRPPSPTEHPLTDEDFQRLADGAPGGADLLRKALHFDVESRPLIVRKDPGGFHGRASWGSLTTGRQREPIVVLLSWDVSIDRGPWTHSSSDVSATTFHPSPPRDASEVARLVPSISSTGSGISVGKLAGSALSNASMIVRYRGTFRVAPRPADVQGNLDLAALTGGTEFQWTSDDRTYLVYDDYPPDYPAVVVGADVDAEMRKAVIPSRVEFGGLSMGSLGDTRSLPLIVHWNTPDGPLAAAGGFEVSVPGRDAVIGTTDWWRSASTAAAGVVFTNYDRVETMILRLPDVPTPDEARLVLDLESGEQKSLRFVFRPSRTEALKHAEIPRYWGGTVNATVPVERRK